MASEVNLNRPSTQEEFDKNMNVLQEQLLKMPDLQDIANMPDMFKTENRTSNLTMPTAVDDFGGLQMGGQEYKIDLEDTPKETADVPIQAEKVDASTHRAPALPDDEIKALRNQFDQVVHGHDYNDYIVNLQKQAQEADLYRQQLALYQQQLYQTEMERQQLQEERYKDTEDGLLLAMRQANSDGDFDKEIRLRDAWMDLKISKAMYAPYQAQQQQAYQPQAYPQQTPQYPQQYPNPPYVPQQYPQQAYGQQPQYAPPYQPQQYPQQPGAYQPGTYQPGTYQPGVVRTQVEMPREMGFPKESPKSETVVSASTRPPDDAPGRAATTLRLQPDMVRVIDAFPFKDPKTGEKMSVEEKVRRFHQYEKQKGRM